MTATALGSCGFHGSGTRKHNSFSSVQPAAVIGMPHSRNSEREAAGQRIARARRRRGLSQAVLAGLVGRSESWLSQVERGKRGVDSHSVLVRLAEVLRVDIEELTGSADRDETGRRAHPAAPLIEQAMMGYGGPGPLDGGEEPEREPSLDFLHAQARSAYQAYQATR
jgi:transcriptional regulator with XRE-family HTH domain